MANYVCVNFGVDGALYRVEAQPGEELCAYVVSDSTVQEVSLRPFDLSFEEAWIITAAIASCWSIGVVVRKLSKILLY